RAQRRAVRDRDDRAGVRGRRGARAPRRAPVAAAAPRADAGAAGAHAHAAPRSAGGARAVARLLTRRRVGCGKAVTGSGLSLAVSVFLACTVEAVEALTIVLAVGSTRSWSAALGGVAAAVAVLASLVAALGPALTSLPIGALRLAVGGLLLVFGLQWLRKAILRAAGLRGLHDETSVFAHETAAARAAGRAGERFDGYSFSIAFKGVFLEGLEVAFIVLTFGASQNRVGLAGAAAVVAVAVVVAAGVAVRAPLARVPENAMKFAVGVMLTSFGLFWGAEGAGANWPGGDAALLAIVPAVLGCSLCLGALLRRDHERRVLAAQAGRVAVGAPVARGARP